MPLRIVTPCEAIRVNANVLAEAHRAVIARLLCHKSAIATAPESRSVGVVVDRGCAIGLHATMAHGAWTEKVHVFVTCAHCSSLFFRWLQKVK